MQNARISNEAAGLSFAAQPEVHIELNRPECGYFTNLDTVSGDIILRIPKPTPIESVTIKLKGESRTKLEAVTPTPLMIGSSVQEEHVLLYASQTVWPEASAHLQDPQQISPGVYRFNFHLKILFNNDCIKNAPHAEKSLNFLSKKLMGDRRPTPHVKDILPPLLEIPDMANIFYYLKVTVTRPGVMKSPLRTYHNINFLPIEPPREASHSEIYVRRLHEFSNSPDDTDLKSSSKIGAFFGKSHGPAASQPSSSVDQGQTGLSEATFKISVEARLPDVAILVRGGNLPLRLFITQHSQRQPGSRLVLQWLQINLVGQIKIRAHEIHQTESAVVPVFTQAGMQYELMGSSNTELTEVEVPNVFWNEFRLPESITPSFRTCNIANSWELHVKVGLEYQCEGGNHSVQKHEISLCINTRVLSGIKPSADLLARMSRINNSTQPLQTAVPPQPPRPGGSTMPTAAQTTDSNMPGFEEPPPSYEDALAADMPPVDGPRPHYQPPERTLTNAGRGKGGSSGMFRIG